MEEDPVARIQEQGDHRDERGLGPEPSRSKEPRDDRACVQERHGGRGQRAARELQQAADDERGDRRPPQHEAEVDRVGLEELDVRAQVGAEVPPGAERDDQRLQPPNRQREPEHGRDAPAHLRQREGAPGEPDTDLADGAHSRPD